MFGLTFLRDNYLLFAYSMLNEIWRGGVSSDGGATVSGLKVDALEKNCDFERLLSSTVHCGVLSLMVYRCCEAAQGCYCGLAWVFMGQSCSLLVHWHQSCVSVRILAGSFQVACLSSECTWLFLFTLHVPSSAAEVCVHILGSTWMTSTSSILF